MVAHFKTQQTLWSQGAQLLDIKQLPTESFEEFAIKVQKLGRKAGVDDEKVRLFIIHGCRGDVRQALLMTGATLSIPEMERVAQLVETAKEGEKSSLEQAIKRVEMKVDAMNVAPVTKEDRGEASQESPTGPRQEQPSQQPRRSWTGQREQTQGWSRPPQPYQYAPRQQYQQRRGGGWSSNQDQYPQMNEWQGQRNMFRGRRDETAIRTANQAGQFGRPPRGGQRNTGPGRFTGDCTTCGNSSLHEYTGDGSCPALGLTCFRCGRLGHMRRVCTTTRNDNQQGQMGPPQGGPNQA